MGWKTLFKRKSRETTKLVKEEELGGRGEVLRAHESFQKARERQADTQKHENLAQAILKKLREIIDESENRLKTAFGFLLKAQQEAQKLPQVHEEIAKSSQLDRIIPEIRNKLTQAGKDIKEVLGLEQADLGNEINRMKKEHEELDLVLKQANFVKSIVGELDQDFKDLEIVIEGHNLPAAVDSKLRAYRKHIQGLIVYIQAISDRLDELLETARKIRKGDVRRIVYSYSKKFRRYLDQQRKELHDLIEALKTTAQRYNQGAGKIFEEILAQEKNFRAQELALQKLLNSLEGEIKDLKKEYTTVRKKAVKVIEMTPEAKQVTSY